MNKIKIRILLYIFKFGVERLHIVDLNGARTGENQNFNIIKEVVKKSNLQIEVGGGIRDMARLDTYMDMGISYAILGTVAVKDPEFVKAAAKKYPNKIILGIDAKNMMAATEGWYEVGFHLFLLRLNLQYEAFLHQVLQTLMQHL